MIDPNTGVETPVQPAPTEQPGVETNEQTPTAPQPAPTEEPKDPIDYKAELEAAQKRIEQAEHVIVETKNENKKLKEGTAPAETPQEFVTADELSEQILSKAKELTASEMQKFKQDLLGDVVAEEIAKASANPDEQALIKFHYDKTIKQSGASRAAIANDIAIAQAIANQKRIVKQNAELKQALIAKNTAGKQVAGGNQESAETPVATEEDKRIADKFFGGDVQRYLKHKQAQNN